MLLGGVIGRKVELSCSRNQSSYCSQSTTSHTLVAKLVATPLRNYSMPRVLPARFVCSVTLTEYHSSTLRWIRASPAIETLPLAILRDFRLRSEGEHSSPDREPRALTIHTGPSL